MSNQNIYLKRGFDKRVKSGHPWVFNNELTQIPKWEPGSLVDILDSNNHFIGRGYYNPHSLICARIFTREEAEEINHSFFEKRILEAFKQREKIYSHDKSYRLVYSEGDYLPGLIIDRYENHYVLQVLTAGIEKWKPTIIEILQTHFHPECIYERSDAPVRLLEKLPLQSQILYGNLNPNLTIDQDGIQFQVDIQEGQKTGFFFDHRNNRRAMKDYIKGKTVLDLFCGTGSWSLYAARFGATQVIGMDSSEAALKTARANSLINSLDGLCEFQQDDVFDGLNKLIEQKRGFDVVICDPPAFAKSRQSLPTAIKGYQKLNTLALQLVKRNELLITSSCSYHIDRVTFRNIITESSRKSKISLQLIQYGMQALDHPILINVPETEYLKCLMLKKK